MKIEAGIDDITIWWRASVERREIEIDVTMSARTIIRELRISRRIF